LAQVRGEQHEGLVPSELFLVLSQQHSQEPCVRWQTLSWQVKLSGQVKLGIRQRGLPLTSLQAKPLAQASQVELKSTHKSESVLVKVKPAGQSCLVLTNHRAVPVSSAAQYFSKLRSPSLNLVFKLQVPAVAQRFKASS
jgi:hypothetical protein